MPEEVVLWADGEEEAEHVARALRTRSLDAVYRGVYHGPARDHCTVVRVATERDRRVLRNQYPDATEESERSPRS